MRLLSLTDKSVAAFLSVIKGERGPVCPFGVILASARLSG